MFIYLFIYLFRDGLRRKTEIWYTLVEWFRDGVLPVAYQAVPKEWIAFQDIEVLTTPIYDIKPGVGPLEMLFGRNLMGTRMENPENPGGGKNVAGLGKSEATPRTV
jgi:hypothetical protein